MNKTQLKEFAVYSRNKLRQDIIARLNLFDITVEGVLDPQTNTDDLIEFSTFRLEGRDNVLKYKNLVSRLEVEVKAKEFSLAFEDFVEEVAYTWFNRIIALRFMEVNGYLSHGFRVLSSSEEGVVDPDILKNYRYLDIGLTDEEIRMLDELSNKADVVAQNKMFQILFLKQCHALNDSLPDLFETTEDYKDLLLPISYTDSQSVIYKLVNEVSEASFDINSEDGSGQIEVIGWLYQYYNTEKKREVDAQPRSQKIRKEDIPSVTQLFTPKWIVQYMVQNSLGRIWIEHLIANGDERTEHEIAKAFQWKYYLPEAKQDIEVGNELVDIRKDRKNMKVEEITFLDPAMGSGHILVYAFDVFMQIYISEGYRARDAAVLILENNLYGLDIDERAYQLSYFALIMKARQYNRKIMNLKLKLNVLEIKESNYIDRRHINYLNLNQNEKNELEYILDFFIDSKEFGSLLETDRECDITNLLTKLDSRNEDYQISFTTLGMENTYDEVSKLLFQYYILSSNFKIVVTNPPYLYSSNMNDSLKLFLSDHYSLGKNDMYSAFMELSAKFITDDGYYGMINQHSWMFLSSYKELRDKVINMLDIVNMLHLGTGVFEEIKGEIVQSTAFISRYKTHSNYKTSFVRLVDYRDSNTKSKRFLKALKDQNDVFHKSTKSFLKVPDKKFGYWLDENFIESFTFDLIGEMDSKDIIVKTGMQTSDNKKFLRFWFEVPYCEINDKFINYLKGGNFKKWYGNNDYVILFENKGKDILENNKNASILPQEVLKLKKLTWSDITTRAASFRLADFESFHDLSGHAIYLPKKYYYEYYWLLSYLNSEYVNEVLKFLNPSHHCQVGDIKNVPLPTLTEKEKKYLTEIALKNIGYQKSIQSLFEENRNFKSSHFTENINGKLVETFSSLKQKAKKWNSSIRENEIEMNLFINNKMNYISKEFVTLTPIITLTNKMLAERFISFFVGSSLGRYSLDEDGLVFSGGQWDINNYRKYRPVRDNALVFSDDGSYSGDVVDRFVEFVGVTFGDEHLEANLNFIADNLSKTGTARERIRKYFINDFYNDHVKKYQKTPIYWMYDSGAGKSKRQQQNGFKALIYMHRYDEDTSGKVRINHLHEVQKTYETEVRNLEREVNNAETSKEKKTIQNRINVLENKLKEIRDYDEKLGTIALERISINLDDGVKVNHQKVQTTTEGEALKILSDIG